MLKILIVNTVMVTIDGTNTVIKNYYTNIDTEDIHFDFVFISEPYEQLRQLLESRGSSYTVLSSRLRKPHVYISKLAALARGYDIVHAHGNSCTLGIEMLAAKLAGVPVRISHSHSSSNKFKTAHRLMKPIFRMCYTDGFACGELAGRWLYGKRPFTVINNGISTRKYAFDAEAREKYRKELGWEDKIILGHVGNFNPCKNDVFLAEILSELRRKDDRYVLVSVGDGGVRAQAEQRVHELGLDDAVIFTGLRPDADKLMQAMDIFVQPSIYEGLPLTLIEAQAAGLECVASDSVTAEVNISGDITYLSLTQDAAKWAEVIASLDCTGREEKSVRRCAVIDESGYGIEASAARLADIYRDLVKERKR